MTTNGSLISCAGANGEMGGQLAVLCVCAEMCSEGIACALAVAIE